MIRFRWMLCFAMLGCLSLVAGTQPRPGDPVDLSLLGRVGIWDGYRGTEWDEPRDVYRVAVEFPDGALVPSADEVSVEYWFSSWPPHPYGGWTESDSPLQGEWREARARREILGSVVSFQFEPLSAAENPNAQNVPGFTPSYRRTLKIRVRVSARAAPPAAIHTYGESRWNAREIIVQTGCEGPPATISVSAYNGSILASQSVEADVTKTRLKVLYTEHRPESNDRTVLTIHGAGYDFGVGVDEIAQMKGIYVKPLGVFLADGTTGWDFVSFLKSGTVHPGEDIISRTSMLPEQSLDHALSEVPDLSLTARAHHHHPFRYIPLGFTASREKYALDFTGNVFINKKSAKAMKEDLARMMWDGDEIYYRLGTGTVPDFRERPLGARQQILEDYLPLVTTVWKDGGVDYEEQAYATMLKAPLDDVRLRGDEPSVLLLRLHARNEASEPTRAVVWLRISPNEKMKIQNGMVFATGDEKSAYVQPRLRALFESETVFPQIRVIPPQAEVDTTLPMTMDGDWKDLVKAGPQAKVDTTAPIKANGDWEEVVKAGSPAKAGTAPPPPWTQTTGSPAGGNAIVWTLELPPHTSKILDIKIPFRTLQNEADQVAAQNIHFDTRLQETLNYWRNATRVGMKLHVPDELLNSFYLAVLEHILLSDEKDVKTGYDICPCGTYDYNIFANETDVQVRLLDMRGLDKMAWRCLRPIVEFQGSKPFMGHFQDSSGELYGVRIDADHDYTSSGYDLNHGWTLWTISEHYFFTRDQDWLKSVLPHIVRAADWIINERKASMQRDPDGQPVMHYGLLPPGRLEDVKEWQYWFAVNAYAYRGLNAAADAVSSVDRAEGERLRQEAESYRKDIRQAALRAMALAPVVRLRDGTYVPVVPTRTALHGQDMGWIRNTMYGAHVLVDCGVFDANEPVATWTLQDYEDNLFMGPDSLSIPDRDWFSRGGMTLQPNLVNTFVSYLERDEVPPALRAFFNIFAVSYHPDINAFSEWVATLGVGGGPFFKTSDEAAFLTWLRLLLVRESGDRLYLDSGAPRNWFLPGRRIEVSDAATFFGTLTLRIESHSDQGFIEAQVLPPRRNPPKQIVLRLRHPQGKQMARVELNGVNWTRFDPGRETIDLPPDGEKISVRAFYP